MAVSRVDGAGDADGRTAVVATVRLRGDLWVMNGLKIRRKGLADLFAPGFHLQ